MYDIATPAVFAFLIGFAVLAIAGVVALVAGGTALATELRGERRIRVARHETIGTYYLGLARSH